MKNYSANPFLKWKLGYSPLQPAPRNPGAGGNLTPANSKTNSASGISNKANFRTQEKGVDVNLPPNFFIPPAGQTVNIEGTAAAVPAATEFAVIFEYIVPQDAMFQITQFSTVTTIPGQVEFTPTVNGNRIWPNIGEFVNGGYRMRTSRSGVLAQTTLKPGDVFRWLGSNASAGPTDLYANIVGFLITNQGFEDTRFGG